MKVILILACSLLFLGLAYTVYADTNQGTIYPVNEGMVNTTSAVATNNMTIQNTPTLKDLFLSYSALNTGVYPFWEFNLSSLPYNLTVDNVSFRFWISSYSIPGNGTITMGSFQSNTTGVGPTGNAPINGTSTKGFYDAIFNGRSAGRVWGNTLESTRRYMNLTTGLIGSFFNGWAANPEGAGTSAFDGMWFNNTYSGGTRSVKGYITDNITNMTWNNSYIFGLYTSTTTYNVSISTSLNTSAPVKPQLIVNYTWNPSEMNSSYPNNNTVLPFGKTYVTLSFNLSEYQGNRTKYQLWFYNASTSEWVVLRNWTATAWAGSVIGYNQSCTFTVGGLITNKDYYWKVVIAGNNTPIIQKFTTSGILSTQIMVYPINEGYVEYDSNLVSYYKFTPWANGTQTLNASNVINDNQRIFFEWNLSHILPPDTNISMINLSYNTTSVNNPAPPISCNWVLIPNTDGNTTNTSSAEYLFNAITSGVSMQNAQVLTYWFSGPPGEILNRSTYAPPIDANSEGYWYYDSTVQRNIRNATMNNISTGQDRMIMGMYIPTGANPGSGSIASTINTTATQRPQLCMNVTYNMSASTGSTFSNTSATLQQPTVSFEVHNDMGSPISYYVMLHNLTSGVWTEEAFVRRATNGTKTVKLYNASLRGGEYDWFYCVVGDTSTTYELYHFTVGYGEVNFCLRYENISSNNRNEMINITQESGTASGQARHRLVIHYANASSTEVWFDWQTYADNGYSANQTIAIMYTPIFFEFTWNYSVNDTATNYTSQYTRILTPNSDTYEGTNEICTFYLTTNEYVYNQYYITTTPAGVTTTNISTDINALVDYSYLFDDQSGYFNPQNTYSTYASIFTYVGSSRIVIDERYIDASAKINPTLKYHSYYYVGIASNINPEVNDYYTNLGLIPTERVTSPYTETIMIYPLSQDTSELMGNISYSFGWQSTGFWILYKDTSAQTKQMMFTVWNVTNYTTTFVTIFWYNNSVGISQYNYTYVTADAWHQNITYKISMNITYTFDSGITKAFTMNSIFMFMPGQHQISGAWINTILTQILGPSPFYNTDTGTTIAYVDWIIMFFGILLLVTFGSMGQPVLAVGSQGILYVITSVFVSGVSSAFIIIGAFLVICAVLYAITRGGRE